MKTREQLPSREYISRFQKWDEKAWVRSKPHRTETEFDPLLYFFAKDVSVLFLHEAVSTAPEDIQRGLLTLQLYNYLEFTVWLEMGPVNEVCDLIRRPGFLPWLPSRMKGDALRIYVDEAGHAEMSHDLRLAVERYSGIPSARCRPGFLGALDRIVESEEPELTPLLKLLFVVVSETLITGTLVRLPKDESVQRAVRELAEDHASDEGRHHAYFRDLFAFVWPRLPAALRTRTGIHLPEMVLAFLTPNTSELRAMLGRFPEAFPLAGRIAEEIANLPAMRKGIADAAAPTIRIMRESGVLIDATIRRAFIERRLLREATIDDGTNDEHMG